ncbi:MAG: inositol monophosphatase family protein [Gemmataceae bacterium]
MFTDYLQAAQNAALQGAEVLEGWRGRFSAREKGRADLVTEADLASQIAVREFLLGQFPDHAFLGEEDGPNQARPAPGAPPTWIVDPIDGTTNYVHDVPCYCVSVGLEIAGELVVGVVYDPRQREMFAAAKGMGATLNGLPLRTSATSVLGEALLSTGFPPDMVGQTHQLDWWQVLSYKAQSLRRTGSTALNLAYVAAGRFDGYWGFDNNAWDVAGGVVLVREAGGIVTGLDGGAYDWHRKPCLATNGPLHPVLVSTLNK